MTNETDATALYRAVAALRDVREGYVTRCEVDGVTVILTRTEHGGVRAFDGTCTHADFHFETARLARGCEIECPIHGARFSAVDGTVRKGPAKEPLAEIPCKVDGEEVLIAPDWAS